MFDDVFDKKGELLQNRNISKIESPLKTLGYSRCASLINTYYIYIIYNIYIYIYILYIYIYIYIYIIYYIYIYMLSYICTDINTQMNEMISIIDLSVS